MTQTFLDKIGSGDQDAVAACIDHYGGLIWTLALRMSHNRADAEDAVQEIFIDLWKSAGRFDGRKSSEKTFVVMVARRRLIDRMRSARSQPLQNVSSALEDLDLEQASNHEQSADASIAAKALAELKQEQRQVLKLSLHLGMSHGEISRVTNLALGTVKSHIRRGLTFIRERLTGTANPEGFANE